MEKRDQEYLEKYGKTYGEVMEQDKADIERWKSPGGWLWLQDKGYYDDPPNPILLLELEDGHYDEDLDPEEVEELTADLRNRLEATPNPPSENPRDFRSKAPF